MSHAPGSLNEKVTAVREVLIGAIGAGVFKNAGFSVRCGHEGFDLFFVNGLEDPNGSRLHFDTASVTKTVVALLTHALIKRGRVRMDMTVGEMFTSSGFEISESVRVVTVGELLVHSVYFNHTVGNFSELMGDDVVAAFLKANADKGTFIYTNSCYILLGAALEAVTGSNLQLLANEVFFESSRSCIHWEPYVPGHLRDTLVPTWVGDQPKDRSIAGQRTHDMTTQRMHHGGRYLCGAAGVFASAPSLASLLSQVFLGDHIISESSKAMLHVNGVGHLKRWRKPGEVPPTVETPPEFAQFGVNMDNWLGIIRNLFASHTGCQGAWVNSKKMAAMLTTDAVAYGDESRKAVQRIFRTDILGRILMA
ncbi:MAG: serine hydrolase [bacterium]